MLPLNIRFINFILTLHIQSVEMHFDAALAMTLPNIARNAKIEIIKQ